MTAAFIQETGLDIWEKHEKNISMKGLPKRRKKEDWNKKEYIKASSSCLSKTLYFILYLRQKRKRSNLNQFILFQNLSKFYTKTILLLLEDYFLTCSFIQIKNIASCTAPHSSRGLVVSYEPNTLNMHRCMYKKLIFIYKSVLF